MATALHKKKYSWQYEYHSRMWIPKRPPLLKGHPYGSVAQVNNSQ